MAVLFRAVVVLVLGLVLASCQGGSGDAFNWKPVFGDTSMDGSAVIARVGEVEITEQDLDLRFDELPRNLKSRYKGDTGRQLLLKDMVNEALLVQGAIENELYNDREVARTLISQRRMTLISAMTNMGIFKDAKPDEAQLREYFDQHRDEYRQLGAVKAQHIECLTKEQAAKAYERLKRGTYDDRFPYVAVEYSVNAETRALGGEIGWFNRGSFVPHITNSMIFSTVAYELADGVNPPVEIDGRWHVIEIIGRKEARPMTYPEAREKVLLDIMPGFQEELLAAWLADARALHGVETFGEYAPGGGLGVDQIFARAVALPDGQDKIDLFDLIVTDFPSSDRVDDALFLGAQVNLDLHNDKRAASQKLGRLLREFPESEFADDAQYILDNLSSPKKLKPQSIEDLKQ